VADPGSGDSSVLRWPSQWRTAAYAGLGAGAGMLAWYAIHVGRNPDESWKTVVLAFALGATLSSFFVEPLVQRMVHSRSTHDRRKIRIGLRWVRGSSIAVSVATFSEVYQGAVLASFDRAGDWLGVCLLAGLMTRAWLDGISVDPPRAARKGARIAPLAVLLFNATGLLAGMADKAGPRADWFPFFAFRTVFQSLLWSLLGFWGGRILERVHASLVARLTLAVGLAGAVLTLASLVLVPTFDPGKSLRPVIASNVLVTVGWWVGLWLCLLPGWSRDVSPGPAGTPAPALSTRLVVGVAVAAAVLAGLLPYASRALPRPSYRITELDFVANADRSIRPWDPHNYVHGQPLSLSTRTPYLHAALRVEYASQIKQEIPLTCTLTDPAGTTRRAITETAPLPDPKAPPGRAAWVVTFEARDFAAGPGRYSVACGTPGGEPIRTELRIR
jgi:RNase H-fold protein (predicted Holliday junction resolvase)